MLLPLWGDNLIQTHLGDPEMLILASRHYSRDRIGKKLGGPARALILRNTPGTVLFLWQWPKDGMRRDRQNGFNCVMFRNESPRLSSEIILEAEQWATKLWGKNRFFTYVDASKVRSINPGACFKHAGWRLIGQSGSGKQLLAKNGSTT